MSIDVGTSNTRVRIVRDDERLGKATVPVGVSRTAVTHSKDDLVKGIRLAVENVLRLSNVGEEELELVIASGMISSNVGIIEIPHISAPAGESELAKGSRMIMVPELLKVPILFIPGVKNIQQVTEDSYWFEQLDVMRGEETEAVGIMNLMSLGGPLTMILPGSHTKVVKISADKKITSCLTTMGGEIFSTIARDALLADSIPSTLVAEPDLEMLLKGAYISEKVGMTRGCFCIRMLNQFLPTDGNMRANFLLGVVLGQDLIAFKNSSACDPGWPYSDEKIIIGGEAPLRQAVYHLLLSQKEIRDRLVLLSDATVEMSTAFGAKVIAEHFLQQRRNAEWDKSQ